MCMTKKKRKYAYGGDEEYSYPQMEKGRHSPYSPMQGPLLEGDRTRYTEEA